MEIKAPQVGAAAIWVLGVLVLGAVARIAWEIGGKIWAML